VDHKFEASLGYVCSKTLSQKNKTEQLSKTQNPYKEGSGPAFHKNLDNEGVPKIGRDLDLVQARSIKCSFLYFFVHYLFLQDKFF
jgi:hypothetical protein